MGFVDLTERFYDWTGDDGEQRPWVLTTASGLSVLVLSLSPWRSRVLSFLALPYSEEERQVSAGKGLGSFASVAKIDLLDSHARAWFSHLRRWQRLIC